MQLVSGKTGFKLQAATAQQNTQYRYYVGKFFYGN